ncbi:hypothetical protein ACHAXH_005113 [Discostella pseudostelligera]|jgi:hypothetical protein
MSDSRQHQRKRKAIDDDDDNNGQGRQQRHQPSQSVNQRRRQAAISLASFSTKKGHDRALQEYKKRKETKFQKNSKLLREYQKVMKQEGYDAGRGASRKRTDRPREEDDDDEQPSCGGGAKSTTEWGESNDQTIAEESRKKRHKSDPLHQAKKEAECLRAEQLEAMSQNEQRQQQEKKKLKDRKVRAKKMMQRTKRGQPLMKNVIGDLLAKIKSDGGDDGSK